MDTTKININLSDQICPSLTIEVLYAHGLDNKYIFFFFIDDNTDKRRHLGVLICTIIINRRKRKYIYYQDHACIDLQFSMKDKPDQKHQN